MPKIQKTTGNKAYFFGGLLWICVFTGIFINPVLHTLSPVKQTRKMNYMEVVEARFAWAANWNWKYQKKHPQSITSTVIIPFIRFLLIVYAILMIASAIPIGIYMASSFFLGLFGGYIALLCIGIFFIYKGVTEKSDIYIEPEKKKEKKKAKSARPQKERTYAELKGEFFRRKGK
jgi:hypothetical protein